MLAKLFPLTLTLILLAIPSAEGAQILIRNNTPIPLPVVLENCNPVPWGTGFIAVGSIDQTDEFIRETSDLPTLASSFIQHGSSIQFGVGTQTELHGFFSADIGGSIVDGNPLIGRKIDIVMGNGEDFLSSTQFAVFRSVQEFPQDNPVSEASVSLGSGEIDGEFLGRPQRPGSFHPPRRHRHSWYRDGRQPSRRSRPDHLVANQDTCRRDIENPNRPNPTSSVSNSPPTCRLALGSS